MINTSPVGTWNHLFVQRIPKRTLRFGCSRRGVIEKSMWEWRGTHYAVLLAISVIIFLIYTQEWAPFSIHSDARNFMQKWVTLQKLFGTYGKNYPPSRRQTFVAHNYFRNPVTPETLKSLNYSLRAHPCLNVGIYAYNSREKSLFESMVRMRDKTRLLVNMVLITKGSENMTFTSHTYSTIHWFMAWKVSDFHFYFFS